MTGYIQEYEPSEEQVKKLVNAYTYHAPKGTQTDRYEVIRDEARYMAVMLSSLCPQSRELSLALTNLEQVAMWANASIARNE